MCNVTINGTILKTYVCKHNETVLKTYVYHNEAIYILHSFGNLDHL